MNLGPVAIGFWSIMYISTYISKIITNKIDHNKYKQYFYIVWYQII